MEGAEKADNQRGSNNNNNNNNNNIINLAQEISRVDRELAKVADDIKNSQASLAQYENEWRQATGEDKTELSKWLGHYHNEIKDLRKKEVGLDQERRGFIESQTIGQPG